MAVSMMAGVAATTITPPAGIQMMGFGARDHGAEGIHDDLHAKALWLNDGETDLVFISTELSAFTVGEAATIKKLLAAEHGLDAGQVLVNNTHTHAGPLVAPRLYAASGEPDPGYMERLRETIVETVGAAHDAMVPASFSVGLGTCDAGIGRRLSTEDGFIMAPNPDEPVNTDSMVLFVERTDKVGNGDGSGEPLAILFSVNCHPTVMGGDNYQISAEYPGVACRMLEARYEGSVALFLQGAAGELKARQVADMEARRFRSGTFEDVQAVGEEVARDIASLLAGGLTPVTDPLYGEATTVALPLARFDDPRALYESVLAGAETTFLPAWAAHHLRRLEDGHVQPEAMECPVQMLQLGRSLTLFAYGGELCSLHADTIKLAIDGPVFTIGYSNGLIGYLPTDQMLAEGGYESITSISSSLDLHAPLAKGIDRRLLNAAVSLYSRRRR